MKVKSLRLQTLQYKMLTDTDVGDHYSPSVRQIDVERNGSNCGFHLTRSKWDPYPWVSSVDEGTAAFSAGMKPGDCILEVNGEDVIGQRVSEIADIVKSKSDQVSLLLWNPGVDGTCSPEALCCGPMPTNLQRLSACMSTILAFLECPVCLDTIPPPTYQCDNGHLICERCRAKSERCPVCRLRYSRGRALLADQIYNALVDAFNLREENDETRRLKMQEIFKLRKKKNIPDIKITQSHTNKFLARLIGKSSSVDNLSSNSKMLSPTNASSSENEFNTRLKTKSLSSNEIFHLESPMTSRSGSIIRLGKSEKSNFAHIDNKNRPASYHGSYESLERKADVTAPVCNSLTCLKAESAIEDGILFHCPFLSTCNRLIKANTIMEHFQINHSGPLIQYFYPKVAVPFNKIREETDLCYVIHTEGEVFFLKIQLDSREHDNEECPKDILLWVWYLGCKKASKYYEIHLELKNNGCENVLLSVRSSVYSVYAVSSQEIRDSKKGIFIRAKTLDMLSASSHNVVFHFQIVKSDTG